MAQTILPAGVPIILAQSTGLSSMLSVEIYQASGPAVYLGIVPTVDNTNGFLLPTGEVFHMVVKPYEILYAYSGGTPTVYTLVHVNEHTRTG